jgi:hypothetical protein
MAEFAADHGADLGDFLDPSKAVEARYQRIVQGCRDGNRCRRTRQLIVVAEILKPADLSTVVVNSSTNRGTPSVRTRIWSTTSGGSALPCVIYSSIAAA